MAFWWPGFPQSKLNQSPKHWKHIAPITNQTQKHTHKHNNRNPLTEMEHTRVWTKWKSFSRKNANQNQATKYIVSFFSSNHLKKWIIKKNVCYLKILNLNVNSRMKFIE